MGSRPEFHDDIIITYDHPLTVILHTRYGSYILVEFFFVLRTVIIVAVCFDRCIHILQPLKYNFFVSKSKSISDYTHNKSIIYEDMLINNNFFYKDIIPPSEKTMLLIALCLFIPFLMRIVPNVYELLHPNTEGTLCRHFQMPGNQSVRYVQYLYL